jgi:hypothetical protein
VLVQTEFLLQVFDSASELLDESLLLSCLLTFSLGLFVLLSVLEGFLDDLGGLLVVGSVQAEDILLGLLLIDLAEPEELFLKVLDLRLQLIDVDLFLLVLQVLLDVLVEHLLALPLLGIELHQVELGLLRHEFQSFPADVEFPSIIDALIIDPN